MAGEAAALNKLADSLEKVANAIEAAEEREKTAAAEAPVDYGTLGQSVPTGENAFVQFLLS